MNDGNQAEYTECSESTQYANTARAINDRNIIPTAKSSTPSSSSCLLDYKEIESPPTYRSRPHIEKFIDNSKECNDAKLKTPPTFVCEIKPNIWRQCCERESNNIREQSQTLYRKEPLNNLYINSNNSFYACPCINPANTLINNNFLQFINNVEKQKYNHIRLQSSWRLFLKEFIRRKLS